MRLNQKFKILPMQNYQVLQHGLSEGGSRPTSKKMRSLNATYETKFCSYFKL